MEHGDDVEGSIGEWRMGEVGSYAGGAVARGEPGRNWRDIQSKSLHAPAAELRREEAAAAARVEDTPAAPQSLSNEANVVAEDKFSVKVGGATGKPIKRWVTSGEAGRPRIQTRHPAIPALNDRQNFGGCLVKAVGASIQNTRILFATNGA
jgi:hypothetical protein